MLDDKYKKLHSNAVINESLNGIRLFSIYLLIFRYHCVWLSKRYRFKSRLDFISFFSVPTTALGPFISNNYFHDSCLTEICLLDKMNQANLYVLTWLLNHLKPSKSKLSIFGARNEGKTTTTSSNTNSIHNLWNVEVSHILKLKAR